MKLEKELQARANLFFYERMFIRDREQGNRACKKRTHTRTHREKKSFKARGVPRRGGAVTCPPDVPSRDDCFAMEQLWPALLGRPSCQFPSSLPLRRPRAGILQWLSLPQSPKLPLSRSPCSLTR
jgi:hypothetical protein